MKNDNKYSDYLASLPKKRMASGMIINDEDGKILLVKPSYKDSWEIPGGVVEENESPLEASVREVEEEVRIKVYPKRLLCVDYNFANSEETEGLIFIFDGGILSKEKIKEIFVDGKEVIEFDFFEVGELKEKLSTVLCNRIIQCVFAKKKGETFYLENQSNLLV